MKAEQIKTYKVPLLPLQGIWKKFIHLLFLLHVPFNLMTKKTLDLILLFFMMFSKQKD